MPRSPRLAFENAFYHVFNRGLNKQDIFLSDSDYQFFLKKLHWLKEKFDFSVYALVVLPNHFHISIQTRKISISKIMASLLTSYSMYFNCTYHHCGPVFQNRFKSILIENNSYFLQLSQYIYVNPVKARLVKNPVDYKYSTIREVLGKESLYFLDEDITTLIGDTKNAVKEYEKFIYDGLKKDLTNISSLFEKEEAILGSNKFATLAKKKLTKRKNKKTVISRLF